MCDRPQLRRCRHSLLLAVTLAIGLLALWHLPQSPVSASGCSVDRADGFFVEFTHLDEAETPEPQACPSEITINEGEYFTRTGFFKHAPRAYMTIGFDGRPTFKYAAPVVIEVGYGVATDKSGAELTDGSGNLLATVGTNNDPNPLKVKPSEILIGMTAEIGAADGSDQDRIGTFFKGGDAVNGSVHANALRGFWVAAGSVTADVTIPIMFTVKSGQLANGVQANSTYRTAIHGKITIRNNDDADSKDVITTVDAIDAVEGKTVEYVVLLKDIPAGEVTVTANNPDSTLIESIEYFDYSKHGETLSRLTFPASYYKLHNLKGVRVNLKHNPGDTTPDSVMISHTVTGLSGTPMLDTVTINIAEAEDTALQFTEMQMTPPTLMVHEAGPPDQLNIRLTAEPARDVRINLALEQQPWQRVTLSRQSLLFTPQNWETPQTITVSPRAEYRTYEYCSHGEFTINLTSPTSNLTGAQSVSGKIIDAELKPLNMPNMTGPESPTIQQQYCHETLLDISHASAPTITLVTRWVGDPPVSPYYGWWEPRLTAWNTSISEYTYKLRLTRDPGDGVTATVNLGGELSGGAVTDLADGIKVKAGTDSGFAAQTSLTFMGGAGGDWSTHQTVTIKVPNTRTFYTHIVHSVTGFPNFYKEIVTRLRVGRFDLP